MNRLMSNDNQSTLITIKSPIQHQSTLFLLSGLNNNVEFVWLGREQYWTHARVRNTNLNNYIQLVNNIR